ncbi:MAG TPA: hypothetical protein VL899_07025 [Alphaproteobacteria bacterium]|nr:hypothetical protein [Alphaproteobacteria bacterium]
MNLKRSPPNANIGTVRVESLHAQRQIRTPPAVIAVVIIIVVTPARPFGVGTLSHLISLEFTGFGGPVFENTCVALKKAARQLSDGLFSSDIYPTIGSSHRKFSMNAVPPH